MTLLSRSFRPSRGALRLFLKPITSAGSLEYSSVRNISSILANAPSATGFDDTRNRNPRRFPSLVGVGGVRCLPSSSAEINVFSSCSDANNDHDDETVEVSRREAHWDIMFNALKSYKAVHGDTLVPVRYPDNPQLGNWVDNQRQKYRMRLEADEFDGKDNSKAYEADERVDKLNSIGFVWNLYDHYWNIRYEELKEYVAEHGNSLVPTNYAKNQSLGLWVLKQRRNFKVGQLEGNLSEAILSKERIEKLDEIGFIWDAHEAQWFERLQELKEYKKNHGDTLVPKVYPANRLLGRWVNTQRWDYSHYQKIKEISEKWKDVEVLDDKVKEEIDRLTRRSTGMTEKRIQLLEAEGFVWDARAYVWESRFQELRAFVSLNGHSVIQERRGGKYDPLARWASTQRQNYKKYNNEQPTTLTEDKIKKMNSIGFAWEIPNTRVQRKTYSI
ncbi:hypothetical protein ACHAW5_009221 [Stephanodiscus triporus]|uniref:Helicase-associated domain-containing protein n=1 Tax=Stephanodiscus triporus TaxID=2934178 RepID=A0ABD3PMK5_9STRA